MNIDYSDLLPGDVAPDPKDPDAATPVAAARPAASTGATGTHAALQHPGARTSGANVVILSADPILIDLLRDAVAGHHRVWRADDATHAADLMVASGNAVLLIDAALADHDTKTLVNQVHQQFPDLAIIVAGRRDDEHDLAPLVSEGVIFRFLHKPASAERIRNFVDATQRRPHGTDLTATLPPRHKNPLFGGTAEVPALSPPFKLNVGDGFVQRWGRRSLLLVAAALIAWGIVAWEPWNRTASEKAPAAAKVDFIVALPPQSLFVTIAVSDPVANTESCGSFKTPPTPSADKPGPMARINTDLLPLPRITKPGVSTFSPVPTNPSVETFISRTGDSSASAS